LTHGSHRFVSHRVGDDAAPGLLTGGVACYRIYETADGALPHGRRARAEVLAPASASSSSDPIWSTARSNRNCPSWRRLFRTRSMREWLDLLEHEDTCVGPVSTLAEAATELA